MAHSPNPSSDTSPRYRALSQSEIESLRRDKREATQVFQRMRVQERCRTLSQPEIEALRKDKREAIQVARRMRAQEKGKRREER